MATFSPLDLQLQHFESVKQPGGSLPRGNNTTPAHLPCTQLHSSAGDTTELLRLSQKSGGTKTRRDTYLSRRPRQFSRLSAKHTHTVSGGPNTESLRCRYRESPGAELRAGYVAHHALSCAVRDASYAYLHTHTSGFHAVPLQQKSPLQFGSPICWGLRSCVNWRACCFSADQRAPRRDNSFVRIVSSEG